MTLRQMIDSDMRSEGVQDFYETVVGLRPVANAHPPSLRNPTKVKNPMIQDDFRPGASKQARKRAKEELIRIFELGQRQIGIPQGGIVAPLPLFPSIDRWT